jgi:hypothetical protein
MIGSPTFYKNTFRTITGIINPVFDNDVVLLCDTSLSTVNLTLLEIVADRFSTQYKLYIVDKSNNAGTNNITITAPIGFTVNNSSVAVINVNNGVAVITISSNTTYNAQFNYTVGGGGAIIVKNEGTIITTNASSFDFVGADVNATAIGTSVTVAIQSNFAVVTYAQLQTLISTNALIPSQQYLITDAIFTFTAYGTNPTVSIIVEAVTNNEITISGNGIFLNADYQGVGDYSGVVGFAGQLGIWYSGIPCIAGNVVIYNNYHWLSLNGTSISPPPTDLVGWVLLPQSSTNGYITEIDIIKYDVAINHITYREDIRNNRIENNMVTYFVKECFWVFQWGNNKCIQNTILSESYFDVGNSTGIVSDNIITQSSFIDTRVAITGLFSSNVIENNSILNIFGCDGEITGNLFHFISIDNISTVLDSNINNNIFKFSKNHLFQSRTAIASISNNIFISNNKHFEIGNDNEFRDNLFEYSNVVLLNNTGIFNNNNFKYSQVNVLNNSSEFIGNNLFESDLQVININLGKINDNIFNQQTIISIVTNDVLGVIQFNKFSSGSLLTITTINNGSFYGNELINNSSVTFEDNQNEFVGNVLNNSTIELKINTGSINNNQFTATNILIGKDTTNAFENNVWVTTVFTLVNVLNVDLVNTNIDRGTYNMPDLLTKVLGGIIQNNVGTVQYFLDLSDPTIFNAGILTIPLGITQFFGEYRLLNGVGQTITSIINLSSRYATKFVSNDVASIVKFRVANGIAIAVGNELVSNTLVFPFDYRIACTPSSFQDSIYIRNNSGLSAIEQVYIYS